MKLFTPKYRIKIIISKDRDRKFYPQVKYFLFWRNISTYKRILYKADAEIEIGFHYRTWLSKQIDNIYYEYIKP